LVRRDRLLNLNTFSIVAHDATSGMLGVAVSTRVPAVGATCPFARAGVGAISTQAWTNPLLGVDGLDLLEQGYSAEEGLQKLLDADPDPEMRQIIAVDREGRSAAHTGSETDPWKGHRTGDGYAVAGNMLVGEETIAAMVEAFEASAEEPLSERLLRALEAGQAAGGDKRGRQSAALYVVRTEPYPYLDLRVDEHTDPVAELRRVYDVAKSGLLPFVEAMPTRENPKGNFGEDLKSKMLQEDR
jgi:uncharacterized Ntn-hydrolase superfamily protein